jgi:V/A-type H+-transporting ATPase subunit I
VDRTENLLLKAAGTSVYLERMEEKEWTGQAGGAHGGDDHERIAAASAEHEEKDADEPHDPYEEVPIALSNPGPVKPFEMLTEMFSFPSYKEIDPTVVLALVFPFFFGLMVGDLAYGILLMVTGAFFVTKLKRFDGFRELGLFILIAGLIAALFGAFVFGDAFGVPFHATGHGEGSSELSWSSLLGVEIPIKASIHKLEVSGLASLLMISVLAGIIHLSLGNIFGVINEWRHNRKHAVAKAGWLCAVLGFGLVMLKAGEVTSMGKWLWSVMPAALGVSWDPGFGVVFPYSSLALLAVGISMAIAGEGGMAMMEVPSVLSNLLSYSRLAAIAIAKGAMAFAFNSILIPMAQGGNIGLAVFGWVLLVMAHMLVFVLGGLSSGIQSLRLNLVEFFMKFYKGGGIKFNPFGKDRRSSSEKAGA